jgi:Kelch motif
MMREVRALAVVGLALLLGCGTGGCRDHRPSARRSAHARGIVGLRVAQTGRLPAPVQLPGLARTNDGRVVAVGGLDAADASIADVTQVLPAPARVLARLPVAGHDIGATAIGDTVYAFGGGTPGAALATITALDGRGSVRGAGRLPAAMSDTSAVTLGATAYVVGGETGSMALDSVLAFRPGRGTSVVARLPHPVRYAAAAAIGSRLYVAGGTTGTHAWRDIVAVDPGAHRARVVGRLPRALAHAAAAALSGTLYVIGGRSDALDDQQAAIWAFDPRTRRLRRAGRLPVALSDLAAVTSAGAIVVVGGRDRVGRLHAERWTLEPR